MYTELLEMFRYSLPSIIVGAIFYLFLVRYFKNEEARRNFILFKDSQKITIPQRLQAYERMVLFLERINPQSLIVRLNVNNTDLTEYRSFLIDNINKEYEHNLAQQIYMSDEAWLRIIEAKILSINMINLVFKTSVENQDSLNFFKNTILELTMTNDQSPTKNALEFLKKETRILYKG